MKYFLLFLLCTPLFAVKIDPSISSFEQRERKQRVDVYDFADAYLNLEKIDIDAKRKKNVELYLTGDYPILKRITFDGGFGTLKGELTGSFPKLERVDFMCGNTDIDFDLQGEWKKSCTVNIRGGSENVAIKLPEDVGVVVHTKTKATGKVVATGLKKDGWLHILNKTFRNELANTAPIVITVNIEITDGQVVLN